MILCVWKIMIVVMVMAFSKNIFWKESSSNKNVAAAFLGENSNFLFLNLDTKVWQPLISSIISITIGWLLCWLVPNLQSSWLLVGWLVIGQQSADWWHHCLASQWTRSIHPTTYTLAHSLTTCNVRSVKRSGHINTPFPPPPPSLTTDRTKSSPDNLFLTASL